MNSDPLIAHETQPTKTVAELVRSDERLKEAFVRIRLPLLILHGTEDKAAKSSGSQFFYDHAGSTDKTLKLYDGHFHDLLGRRQSQSSAIATFTFRRVSWQGGTDSSCSSWSWHSWHCPWRPAR